jgi:hypothetical protein
MQFPSSGIDLKLRWSLAKEITRDYSLALEMRECARLQTKARIVGNKPVIEEPYFLNPCDLIW